eukprot:3882870-Pleurochrysis_carterae.AAC.7
MSSECKGQLYKSSQACVGWLKNEQFYPGYCAQDLLMASSYGVFGFSKSGSRIVDVYMNKNVPVESDGCPIGEEADRADDIVKASGIDPKSYTHREYFVPSPFGVLGCKPQPV